MGSAAAEPDRTALQEVGPTRLVLATALLLACFAYLVYVLTGLAHPDRRTDRWEQAATADARQQLSSTDCSYYLGRDGEALTAEQDPATAGARLVVTMDIPASADFAHLGASAISRCLYDEIDAAGGRPVDSVAVLDRDGRAWALLVAPRGGRAR